MSKRRNKRSWRNHFGGKRRNQTNLNRQRRLNGVEPLEPRQVLAAYTIDTANVSVQAMHAKLVEDAWQRSSDLSLYTASQLEQATSWVVQTNGSINSNNFRAETGMFATSQFTPLSNTFFAAAGTLSSSEIIANLQDNPGIVHFYPQIGGGWETFAVPNDPMYAGQWHLNNTGQEISLPNEVNDFGTWGADIRAEGAWEYTTGEGVTIAIVDDSLMYAHPDLIGNYDPSLSFDYVDDDPNPAPAVDHDDHHGTAVAGLAVADGDNGEGVTGVAYDATLAGIRLIGYGAQSADDYELDFYNALTHMNQEIDIYNNSFGRSNGRAITTLSPVETQSMIDAVFLGRGGYGSLLVNATGNSAGGLDRTDHDSFASSRYTIGVTGFSSDGGTVGYAEGGASVWVAAPTGTNPPGKGVTTTDVYGGQTGVEGDAGYNDGHTTGELDNPYYTNGFNGTSAASPIGAGAMGLVLSAARENGIELSLRDVKNILALSARKIDETSSGWQTDLRPLFFDPAQVGGVPVGLTQLMGPGVTALPTMIDPETGELVTDVFAQYVNSTNSAGFFVHDSTSSTGYGHGAIDVEYAVQLASNWHGVGTQSTSSYQPTEQNIRVIGGGLSGPILIPAAETTESDAVIPGAPGGRAGFADYFDLWLTPPDELPDPLPRNTRGSNIDITIPANLSIEDIEVALDITIPAEASDKLRMTLISPDGTQSELTNWIQDGSIGPLTDTGQIQHTFTTVRHWGERSEGVGRIDPLTGERIEPNAILGANGEIVAGVWQIAFENWSDSEAVINNIDVSFYGSPTPVVQDFNGQQLGGRIQGSIGLDTNQDGEYNFTGITATILDPVDSQNFDAMISETPVISSLESLPEPRIRGVTVYVDLNKNETRDANEPYMLTGANGNFYFDLAYNQPGTTYDVRFELPEGYNNLGTDVYQYTVGVQDDGDPETEDPVISNHIDAHFLLEPQEVTFEGNVFADFNLNAAQDSSESTVEQFRVFIDLNENGKFDFNDLNANNVFDNGIDTPREPMTITGPDGSYIVTMSTDDNLEDGFFGQQLFLVDRFVGAEYYTVMLDAVEGWTPTNSDVSEPEFANVLYNSDASSAVAYYRRYVTPGETVTNLNFGVSPEQNAGNATLSGYVFNDVNQNGVRNASEAGLAGATVFLDLDENGEISDGDLSVVTGANGSYLFEHLAAGTYDILVVAPPGYSSDNHTFPVLGYHPNVTLAEGQAKGGGYLDFGFYNADLEDLPERDYGDLPDSYGTTAAAGGASHGYVADYYLGAGVSVDSDGQPATNGDLDTDDDGVEFLSPIVAGSTVSLNVTASTNVLFLQGWIDFNNDGDFNDAGEHLTFSTDSGMVSKQLRLDAGLNELTFTVPSEVASDALAARFRYGEGGFAQFNKPSGSALVGEVEDYVIAANPSTAFIEPIAGDFDGSGVVDKTDYQLWKSTFGSTTDLRADANGSGSVDLADFTVWRNNLGAVAPVQVVMSPIAASTSSREEQPAELAAALPPGPITTGPDGLTSFSTSTDEADDSTPYAETNDATGSSALDLAFDLEMEDEDNGFTADFATSGDDAGEEAFAVALEEDFGDWL
ncbi:S8 family serine peptidase [Aeoliella sp. ICT_H6.2]|uniref:S8 family serine peptidase n=1 Tax=Aeoliella straminimaris TaxID=2954799 RepID=A0A9X2JHZ2_9BACT|nr:S8 family serine peptidase [Aeoliella straminimaris]MCO6046555.1 S8 family serine peptidase [Aeoliella straminimaris]